MTLRHFEMKEFCFICGQHETAPCLGGLTGRELAEKHHTKIAEGLKDSVRHAPNLESIPTA